MEERLEVGFTGGCKLLNVVAKNQLGPLALVASALSP